MRFADVLTEAGFSKMIQERFLSSGIVELYPPQAQAIEQGVLSGENLVMSVPTASGKTLCSISFIAAKKTRSRTVGSEITRGARPRPLGRSVSRKGVKEYE